MLFRQILKRLLVERDISGFRLSQQVHIPSPTVYNYLSVTVAHHSPSNMEKLCKFFGMTAKELIGDDYEEYHRKYYKYI